MSIRFKILLGCLSLTLVTVLLGGFTQYSQREVGSLGISDLRSGAAGGELSAARRRTV